MEGWEIEERNILQQIRKHQSKVFEWEKDKTIINAITNSFRKVTHIISCK